MKLVSISLNVKTIGVLLILISLILLFIVYSYTQNILAISLELHKNCPLPEGICPYKRSAPIESYLGFTLSGIVGVIGGYLVLSQRGSEKFTMIGKNKLGKLAKTLEGEEKQVYKIIEESEGSVFQNDLIQKTGFSKVKVSRILDRLETKGLAERRRRGMSNIVVLKI